MGATEIAAALLALREKRRLTLAEVAKKAGLGTTAVWQVENGRDGREPRITPATHKVAKVLGVKVRECYELVPLRRRRGAEQ